MDPLGRLHKDRRQARKLQDPWAELCVVSTVAAGGEPSARVLVVRELNLGTRTTSPSAPQSDDRHTRAANPALGIFVNASSPKVDEFSRSSTVAVLIYLPSVMVQYRLRCTLKCDRSHRRARSLANASRGYQSAWTGCTKPTRKAPRWHRAERYSTPSRPSPEHNPFSRRRALSAICSNPLE